MIKHNDYPKIKYEIRPSKIIPGSVGLFTMMSFKKGSVVIDYTNWDESSIMSWSEFDKLDPKTKKKLIDFCYKTDEGVHVPVDINRINIGYFSNHSCDPNVYSNERGDYVAKRDIQEDEELTIDVERLMGKTIFEFDCSCGSKNCRKRVRI